MNNDDPYVKYFHDKLFEKFGGNISFKSSDFNLTRMKFRCTIHGKFISSQNSILNTKFGCKKCATEATSGIVSNRAISNYDAILKEVHGDRFEFIGFEPDRKHMFKYICSIHGELLRSGFHVTPCRECFPIVKKKVKNHDGHFVSFTFEQWIIKAVSKYGEKFDYSLIDKDGFDLDKNVLIVCDLHGVFQITFRNHLQSRKGSCPKCFSEARRNYMLTQNPIIKK